MEKIKETKEEDRIIRILSKDIPGRMKIYAGLAKIKGISWGLSNAVCSSLNIDGKRKIGSLNNDEIQQIEKFIKNPDVPAFLLNRRFDFDSGENKNLVGSNLELQKEFDIKRLKKIKSYKGIRHSAGLPVRGQRTKSHFRKQRKRGVGIKKKKKEIKPIIKEK